MSLSFAGRVVQLLDADVDVPVRRRRLLLVDVPVDVDRAVRHLQQRHVGQQQRWVARREQRSATCDSILNGRIRLTGSTS